MRSNLRANAAGSPSEAVRTGADPVICRWAFTGMLPQAGLALALPLLYPKILGDRSESSAALVLGIVGINQVVMPVLLRLALLRAGETGKASPDEDSELTRREPETRPT